MFFKYFLRRLVPDAMMLRYWYWRNFKTALNLKNPCTFNEKLQWLKLYNRDPFYSKLVDKYEVKKWVADKIGEQYVIPTYGVWNKFEDIKFDKLPTQFVLKCTHDSGGIAICKDKSSFDVAVAQKKLSSSLKRNFYYHSLEWPYKTVPHRIIAEKYMEDKYDKELRDYKFYTFNGEPQFLLLATNRQRNDKSLCFDYYDMNFKHLPLTNHWHPNNEIAPPHKPQNFDKMKELCRVLAKGIPHVRVDFYEVDGQIYFGEMTFFDMGGFLKLHPSSWEKEWGNLIILPPKK